MASLRGSAIKALAPYTCRQCLRSLTRQFSPVASFATSSKAAAAPDVDGLRRQPAKIIYDHLSPTPSHLLTTTLSDLLHAPDKSSSPRVEQPPRHLPQGHHLVYFPIQTPPSQLAFDGADPDHSPGPAFARRLWAGGEVVFHRDWHRELLLDGRPAVCKEEIGDVVVRGVSGHEKVFVDVWRRYGSGHDQLDLETGQDAGAQSRWQVEERRTLAFMRNDSTLR